jgi:hypothetical protein
MSADSFAGSRSLFMLSVILLDFIMLSVANKPFMLSVILLNVIMLSVANTPFMLRCHFSECRYAERHCTECRGAII